MSDASVKEIRAWAVQNGYTVGLRGRLPSNVIEAFAQAQSAPEPKAKTRRRTAKTV